MFFFINMPSLNLLYRHRWLSSKKDKTWAMSYQFSFTNMMDLSNGACCNQQRSYILSPQVQNISFSIATTPRFGVLLSTLFLCLFIWITTSIRSSICIFIVRQNEIISIYMITGRSVLYQTACECTWLITLTWFFHMDNTMQFPSSWWEQMHR